MNEIKIDIPVGMCIDIKNSNFIQGIIKFKSNVDWNSVYRNAEECEINSAFPMRTKAINMLMHLAKYLNSHVDCSNVEKWTIYKNREGEYISGLCTYTSLITFKTMDLAKIAINIIGKQYLDIIFDEQYLFRK